jgi:hypothetical protein
MGVPSGHVMVPTTRSPDVWLRPLLRVAALGGRHFVHGRLGRGHAILEDVDVDGPFGLIRRGSSNEATVPGPGGLGRALSTSPNRDHCGSVLRECLLEMQVERGHCFDQDRDSGPPTSSLELRCHSVPQEPRTSIE